MTNERGRPAIQLTDLDPNWRTIMLDIYEGGGSDTEVKVSLAIPPSRALSNDLWEALKDRESDFSEAVKEGQQLSKAWWMKSGRTNLITGDGVKFSTALWFINMKNRFGWKDKVELSGDKDAPPVFTLKIDNS